MEKIGERDRKLCIQLYINITFNYFDCKQTPPDSKAKATSKSKFHTIYITRLDSDIIELSSD